ncbi:MAG: MSMEG_4193 family putative phosphomutase [Chloroflexi bacterium]|nr:MSMEG_4193 family putative phosphomutase [Chloroflexota bacterium]MCI0578439.1 MSMEG_4193 family putative phosphomutase [Chloroflexota bacterium]MCI0643885.1 MSMEG_4193 family putative phosphomutase [Chloroflexota bacterium]MCI0729205.1 MSMEG_4193 family putative phosphomutase [Chloroflexota bacterium]
MAGWTPGVHLNEEGQKAAEQLAERLASLPLKAIYSSPLERCLETAATLARPHQLEVVEVADLGEVRFGDWEGQKLKALAKEKVWYAVQHTPSRFRFPHGESFLEVQQRAVATLEGLSRRHEKEAIAVVSHADVIKLVLAHYLGIHLDMFQRLHVAPTSVSVLALPAAGGVHVLRLNDDGPIRFPEPDQERPAKKQKAGKQKAARSAVASANGQPAADDLREKEEV